MPDAIRELIGDTAPQQQLPTPDPTVTPAATKCSEVRTSTMTGRIEYPGGIPPNLWTWAGVSTEEQPPPPLPPPASRLTSAATERLEVLPLAGSSHTEPASNLSPDLVGAWASLEVETHRRRSQAGAKHQGLIGNATTDLWRPSKPCLFDTSPQ